jgi:hypothetical protein
MPPQISTTLSGYSCTTDYSTTVATTDRTLDSWTDSPEVSPRRGLRVPEVLAARTRSRMADVSDSPNSHTKLYTAYDSSEYCTAIMPKRKQTLNANLKLCSFYRNRKSNASHQ